MAHLRDTVRGRQIVARWQALAEQRLQYLLDLRASGRWRRYYSEAGLAADIAGAERAVEAWRLLAPHAVEPPPVRLATGVPSTALPPVALLPHDVPVEHHLRQA